MDSAANAIVGAGNRTQAFKGYTLGYDATGAVISKAGNGASYTYTWDALGRLKELRNGGALVASFAYDALGRRVSKTLGDGTTERYVYDGDHVIMDVTGTHAVKAEYGYEPGVDRLFAIKNTQGSAWTGIAITDPKIGSIWAIANLSGGSIRKTYGLSVWGTGPADTGVITRFRMAGREYDQATKLYYNRARYYDPELGRFLSEDGTGPSGGLNLYTYAGNDPVNFTDPTGTECEARFERIVTYHYDGDGRLIGIDYGPWEYVGTYCDDGSGGGGGWVPGGGGGGPGGAPPALPQPRPEKCPAGPTQWPVGGPQTVSSPFGATRRVGTSPHVGMDIPVPVGTAVYPIAPGLIASVRNSNQGWTVEVSHGSGLSSVYRHLSAVNGGVSFVGDPVDLQDVLGWSGTAGTGPHLHLELQSEGRPVNPGACLA